MVSSSFPGLECDLIGPYELIRRISTGGMADIFLARRAGLREYPKHLVVKRLELNVISDATTTALFLHEAKVHAALHHPNIVYYLDFLKTKDCLALVLEYVQGLNLHELIAGLGDLPLLERSTYAFKIIDDVLAALQYVHSRHTIDGTPLNLVHQDVSPANILISRTGTAKICDFGLAKSCWQSHSILMNSLKGKFRYFAPEQLAGRELDHRTDLFSVALCLYEIITLRPLFREQTINGVIRTIRSGQYFADLYADVSLPRQVRSLLAKALKPSPQGRFSDARQFRVALRDLHTHLRPQIHLPLCIFAKTPSGGSNVAAKSRAQEIPYTTLSYWLSILLAGPSFIFLISYFLFRKNLTRGKELSFENLFVYLFGKIRP